MFHAGRYWINVSDTIVEGTFRQWKEGSLDSAMYFPGISHLLYYHLSIDSDATIQ